MDQSAKQQAVENIKQATNVLVTVSANPSVDQLSAALGLTLMLSKLEKHATAVFSGKVPEAIKFLEPDKTLESNVDSLRDFIIALDKEKADKLRYKVEDDIVRIFITPYRTKITKEDFQFTQGDFNVDVVVALGVEEREDLDSAIKAHGRILHDSTVVTVNAGTAKSQLGATNWSDGAASSLCEMLVSVSESFGSGLLDQQISTAYLTGIVAATERFSNNKTSPKVMTMSAQLMAAGANQQLIASELRIEVKPEVKTEPAPSDNPKIDTANQQMNEISLRPSANLPPPLPVSDTNLPNPTPVSESSTPAQPSPPGKTLKDLENEIAAVSSGSKLPKPSLAAEGLPLPPIQPLEPEISNAKSLGNALSAVEKPTMGGTFNATASEARDEIEKQRQGELKSTILAHSDQSSSTAHAPLMEPMPSAYLRGEPGAVNVGAANVNAARDAVSNAVNSQPFDPSNNPLSRVGSQSVPLDDQPQQINIDDNGMINLREEPAQPLKDPNTPATP